jgi:hypothetical protein
MPLVKVEFVEFGFVPFDRVQFYAYILAYHFLELFCILHPVED